MPFLHFNRPTNMALQNPDKPELFRDNFPYTKIGRVNFDDHFLIPRPAEPMFITDTTFRDGQQARPPYTVAQIATIFDFLHKLGGHSGLIRQSEFFLYSKKDRKAVEACMAKDYKFPEVTGWIRANADDLRLVKEMGLHETGMLTSVSDYHIYMKLGKDRQQAMNDYLAIVEKALEWGIVPRCHFEDVTRADIMGFCVPFAARLMELASESGLPVKIRLCDTLGFGVPYPGAALPRSVARIVRAFTDHAGVPSQWLEWHGHNDFHKVLVNAATAWLYGCSGANGTLLGFGERTGNAPLEALVIEYISLTGEDDAAVTETISEIGDYFARELDYHIPENYPFVGRDFNATSAGIHVDGLIKNEEIYNIFDTTKILRRPVPIIITDKTGKAGVAYWINQHLDLSGEDRIDKRHPTVAAIAEHIARAYEGGRTTHFSNKEMKALVKRYLPELFPSEFDHLKRIAHKLAARIIEKLSTQCEIRSMDADNVERCMDGFLTEYPFIQYMYLIDTTGHLTASAVCHDEDRPKYKTYDYTTDFSGREWFTVPMRTGKLHVTDFYKSHFTGKLCLTVSTPVDDEDLEIQGILGADIRFEELLRRHEALAMEDDDHEDGV
ncbi:isopropylmalate/homocitrate/citramalate synthase [Desulfobaculum xiamenense]|uniref:Isopropylmalate/homocitrate/citramalate synthase n=1 Tax=Desulfobaculum xiamenense TaxID=995050 RepID=A0A846QH14_9BACT|nr:histone-lysine N-methyltransferase [Desulfobaculum xiamenense]NJB68106.1 isopropylmalate/homocitrate/citramalate synthase [Desulfobaculum xiamenense]